MKLRSSSGGSIERSPVYSIMAIPAYKVSKAALNMLTVQYAQSYADEGFTFLAVNPGVSLALHFIMLEIPLNECRL